MKDLTKKYYSKEEILDAAKAGNISEKYVDELIDFIDKYIQDVTEENQLREDEINEWTIKLGLDYIRKYSTEIEKGHSAQWAGLYAGSIEYHQHAFNDAYKAIREQNTQQALEELKIHCKAVGADEYYTKHFIFLMENAAGTEEIDPDTQAANYSHIYKEQLELGKSPLFSDKYADYMANDEWSEAYCFAYAKYYEEAIVKGKTEDQAVQFALAMAEYYGDAYSFGKDIQYDEYDKMHEDEIREQFGMK